MGKLKSGQIESNVLIGIILAVVVLLVVLFMIGKNAASLAGFSEMLKNLFRFRAG